MPKRKSDPWDTADAAGQAKHRPDQPPEMIEAPEPAPGRAEGERKREHQEQINVLVAKGLRLPFRHKAEREGTTMSELIVAWVREYLAGKQ